MLIYLFAFFLSYIFAELSKKVQYSKSGFLFFSGLAILIPALLAGFRDMTVGRDLRAYMVPNFNAMLNAKDLHDFIITAALQKLEILYQFYNFIITRFSEDLFWAFFIQQIIILCLFYILFYFFREKINYPLAFLIYLLFLFCISMSMNRQIFAVAIVSISYIFILKRKLFAFLICVTIALGFHNSAIFAYFLYPLFTWINKKEKPISNITIFVFIIAGFIFFISFPKILQSLLHYGLVPSVYERYVNSEHNVHKTNLLLIVMCFFLGYSQTDTYVRVKNNIKLLSILTFFTLLCGVYNDTAQRAAYYIEIYLLIQVLVVINSYSKKQFYSYLFMLIMLFNFIYLACTTQFAEVIPYTSKTLNIF